VGGERIENLQAKMDINLAKHVMRDNVGGDVMGWGGVGRGKE